MQSSSAHTVAVLLSNNPRTVNSKLPFLGLLLVTAAMHDTQQRREDAHLLFNCLLRFFMAQCMKRYTTLDSVLVAANHPTSRLYLDSAVLSAHESQHSTVPCQSSSPSAS